MVERFGLRAIESFEFFILEFGQNSARIQENLLESIRNSAILWISHHPLKYSAKFREILITIDATFDVEK